MSILPGPDAWRDAGLVGVDPNGPNDPNDPNDPNPSDPYHPSDAVVEIAAGAPRPDPDVRARP